MCASQMLANAAQEGDLERVARVSKALLDNASAVDVMALYVGSLEVLLPFATLLDRTDLGEIADEPSVLCSVILFAQWLLNRAEVRRDGPTSCLIADPRSSSSLEV
jgi:hypothetical protein